MNYLDSSGLRHLWDKTKARICSYPEIFDIPLVDGVETHVYDSIYCKTDDSIVRCQVSCIKTSGEPFNNYDGFGQLPAGYRPSIYTYHMCYLDSSPGATGRRQPILICVSPNGGLSIVNGALENDFTTAYIINGEFSFLAANA